MPLPADTIDRITAAAGATHPTGGYPAWTYRQIADHHDVGIEAVFETTRVIALEGENRLASRRDDARALCHPKHAKWPRPDRGLQDVYAWFADVCTLAECHKWWGDARKEATQ